MSFLGLEAYTDPAWSVAVYPAAIYTHRGRAYLEGSINCGENEGVPGGPVIFDGIPAQFRPATDVRLHLPIDPSYTAGVFEQFVDNGTFEVEMTAGGKLWLPPDIAPQIGTFDLKWLFGAVLTGANWPIAGETLEDDVWTSESLGAYIVVVAFGDGYGDDGSVIGRDGSRVHLGGEVVASPRADGHGGGYIMGSGRFPAAYYPGQGGSITPTGSGGGRQWTLLTGAGAGSEDGQLFVQDQYRLDFIYANVNGTNDGAVLAGISTAPDEMPEFGMSLLGGVDPADPGIDFLTRVRLTDAMPRLTAAQVAGGLEPDLPDAPGIVWGASWHAVGDELQWAYYKAVVRMGEDSGSLGIGQSIYIDVYAVDQDRSDGPAGRPSERHIARIPSGALGAPVTMADGGEEWFRIASFMDLTTRNVHIRIFFGNPSFYTEIVDTESAQGASLGELDSAGLFGTLESTDASMVGLTEIKRIDNPANGPMSYITDVRPQEDEHIDLTGAGWWRPATPRFMAVL